MKWLIGFLLILCAGLAGVYGYRTYFATGDGPLGALPDRTKSEAPKEPPGEKIVAPIEKRPPQKAGSAPGFSVIRLPAPVAKARFGMSPEKVTTLYKVVQRLTDDDRLVLVHYLRPDKMEEARFIFVGNKLKRIEIVTTPRYGERLDNLYNAIQTDFRNLYGRLPDSRRNRWSDGVMEAGVGRSNGVVTLYFRSHR